MLLKTKEMHERLVRGGFTDQQAGALITVVEELAEVFVTKDYLDARLAELRKEMYRMAFLVIASVAALLAIFEFVL